MPQLNTVHVSDISTSLFGEQRQHKSCNITLWEDSFGFLCMVIDVFWMYFMSEERVRKGPRQVWHSNPHLSFLTSLHIEVILGTVLF